MMDYIHYFFIIYDRKVYVKKVYTSVPDTTQHEKRKNNSKVTHVRKKIFMIKFYIDPIIPL